MARGVAAKGAEPKVVRCLDCSRAYLMQRERDPVVSKCEKGRNVARTPHLCDRFQRQAGDTIIHEMINFNLFNEQ